jgi:glycosyltransferase involved in cell wall biosynthesis
MKNKVVNSRYKNDTKVLEKMKNLKFFTCPICQVTKRRYLFSIYDGLKIFQCNGCGLVFSEDQPVNPDITGNCIGLYKHYVEDNTETVAAGKYLNLLATLGRGGHSISILAITPENNPFIALAKEKGFHDVTYLALESIKQMDHIEGKFDVAVLLHQLEQAENPAVILNYIHKTLKHDGDLFLVTSTLDSLPAHLLGKNWHVWRKENRYYFNNKTLQLLLWCNGFTQVEIEKDRRPYTLEHLHQRATNLPQTWFTSSINLAWRLLPRFFRKKHIHLPNSAVVVSAKKEKIRERPLLSIVMPVYNEKQTFTAAFEAVLEKQIQGIDKEIIIIESNSTDGSRDLVLGYQNHPDVKILLQNEAKGKGNAMREGFQYTTGDIILIQDADLEYDLNDWDALLEPVVNMKTPFVLGSRHTGSLKMREFENQFGITIFMNIGQIIFTSLLNILYCQKMKDPFTMYKIFWRDCLHGINFECDRFDFDHELVIKLVRKGYTPLEIPVNYTSRSFKEGKKVQMFRDPLLWIWYDFKFRFEKMNFSPRMKGINLITTQKLQS